MKHYNCLTSYHVLKMKIGEEFTYKTGDYFKKGIKISPTMMIPIGLTCSKLENAQKQN